MPARHPPLFDALARHANTGVVLAGGFGGDAPSTIREVNAAFATMAGRPRGELIGQPLRTLVDELIDGARAREIRGALLRGESVVVEFALVRPGGERLWLEADVAPGPGAGEIVLVVRDVTERRHAERALAHAEELLRMATEAGNVGVWEWTPDTGELHWDATLRNLVGVGEHVRPSVERWFALVHPDDLESARHSVESRFAGGEGRYRILRADDGRVRHVVVRASVTETSGHPRLVGMVLDVTEAQEAAARVEETLESMTDAYFAIDAAFHFTGVNRNAEHLLQRRRDELLGRSMWEVFPDARGTVFEDEYRRALEDGVQVEFEAFYPPLNAWFEVRAFPVADGIAVYFRNIDERRAAEVERENLLRLEQQARQVAEAAQRALQHQAAHDPLTDLANRPQLLERLDRAIRAGSVVHLLFIDVDRFKLVNDTLGHPTGDALLRAVAARLAALVRRQDVVARIGGDEFVVGLIDTDLPGVEAIVARVLEAIRTPVELEGQQLVLTASIGIAEGRGGATAESLLRDADVALYRAKDAGRDRAVWFDARARHAVLARVATERDLRHALEHRELDLHYQPAFDLRTGRMIGVEGLLRWSHPERGAVAPLEFISVAEESGLIVPIGDWVLGCVAAQAHAWRGDDAFTAWANVSPRQLAQPGLADRIERHLAATGLPAAGLGIEVTESALGDWRTVVDELERIAELGVQVAIDDFGTGFSSIGRLRDFHVDVLKIDRSFVAGIAAERGADTVAAIVDLGHALGRTVVAEGVETTEQAATLRDIGCDAVAGFLLAPAVPAPEVAQAAARGAATLAAV